jgi:hypothetical protein
VIQGSDGNFYGTIPPMGVYSSGLTEPYFK